MKKNNSHFVWLSPGSNMELHPHQVDVWRSRLDLPMDRLDQLKMFLSVEEMQRAARFHFPADRNRFIAAHGCLRDILARYLHCNPDQLTFSVNSYGKPALLYHELEFNLSHSGDFALIAVSQGHRVGVDVERIRQGVSSQDIAQHHFSKSELAELQTLPPELSEIAFFTCWTRKEAYIKAQGLGLSLPLENFDVSLTPGEPAALRATRPDPQEAARWSLFALDVDPYYAAAVAVESKNMQLRLWDWSAH